MTNKLNFVRLTLDAPYAKGDSTFAATASTLYRKGQDSGGSAQYYDIGPSGGLLWTQGRVTIEEKSGKRLAVVAIDGVAHNGTTADGRNKYTLTVDTADDGSTLMTGLKQTDDGTNSVNNVDADLAVDQFPEGSVVKIAWDVSAQNALEDAFTANSTTDTATAGEAIAARKVVAIDSTDGELYLFDDANANHTSVGISSAAYSSGNTATYIKGGGTSTGHSGLTPGKPQFASTTTAGDITETNTGYPLGRANDNGTAINVDLSSAADPASDAEVTAGTSTDLRLFTPAQVKLSVDTHVDLSTKADATAVQLVVWSNTTPQTLSATTNYTFTHNLGVAQSDVEQGRYKLVITGEDSGGNGMQLNDAGGSNAYWGSGSAGTVGFVAWGVTNDWSASTPTTQYVANWQANEVRIDIGSTQILNARIFIYRMW